MKPKEILVFGATGQIGRHLLRYLTRKNFKVTVVTRNIHRKAYILKSQANAGWLNIVEMDKPNNSKLSNLIGILNEKNKSSFDNIHHLFPMKLAQLAKEYNLDQLIHISSLGIEDASDSKYASSKLSGENKIKKIFKNYVILKPSLVYSVDDNFTTMLMGILKLLPIFPIYYDGKTAFHPIHVTDICEIIYNTISREFKGETIECIGPEKLTFKEIIQKILKSLGIKRILLPMPLTIAKLYANFFEIVMKNPLITRDQLTLLKYNNTASKLYKTNIDFNLNTSLKNFDQEIIKYSYMWKSGGEFSKEKTN